MSTQLQAMVEFLSGREGAGSYRIRSELADPDGDAARFLATVQRLSRDVLAPHVFKGLGLPPSTGGRVPHVPAPPATRSALRRFLRILPWLTTVLAAGTVVLLWMTCPCHQAKPKEPGQAVAALVPPADGGTPVLVPAAAPTPPDPAPSRIAAPSPPPKDDLPAEVEIPVDEPKALPIREGDAGEDDLRGQIADLQSRLAGAEAEATATNGRRTDLQAKLRAVEVENDRLRGQTVGLQQDLQADQTEKEKRRQETIGLAAQIAKMKEDRGRTVEAAVTSQTASLQGNLDKVGEELRAERARNELVQKQLDEQVKSGQAAQEALATLRQEVQALSDKLRVKQEAQGRPR